MQIRVAIQDDAEALAELSTQLGYPADAATIATRMRDLTAHADDAVLVAVADAGRVVGFAHAMPRYSVIVEPFVELVALVVDDTARGAGVGAGLLAAVESWARGHGYATVRVRSSVVRERAHHFYLREGYSECKRQAVFLKSL